MNLSSYRSQKTDVRQSFIHGRGLFAKEQILKREIVVVRSGHIVDRNTIQNNKNIIKNSELQISEDLYLAPLNDKEFESVMTFVNHSCEPNLGLSGNIIFVAMRNIEKGEELTLDYAMFSSSNDYSFVCQCKQLICRKHVASKDWMNKELQIRYGSYFSSYLLSKISNI